MNLLLVDSCLLIIYQTFFQVNVQILSGTFSNIKNSKYFSNQIVLIRNEN